jgi:hypothetical protein
MAITWNPLVGFRCFFVLRGSWSGVESHIHAATGSQGLHTTRTGHMATCCTWSSCELGYVGGGGGGYIEATKRNGNREVLIEATNRNGIRCSHIPLDSSLTHVPGICSVLKTHIGPFAAYSTYTCCFSALRPCLLSVRQIRWV